MAASLMSMRGYAVLPRGIVVLAALRTLDRLEMLHTLHT